MMNGRLNGLVCAVCIMLCGIYSVSVNAATAGSAVFQAYSVLGKKRVGSNIRVDFAVKTNYEGSHIPRYKTVTAEYTPNDLAAMFASLKNKAPSSAIATIGLGAIVGGAGWAIDELTGQVVKPTEVPIYPDGYVSGHYATINGSYVRQTAQESCSARNSLTSAHMYTTSSGNPAFSCKHADGRTSAYGSFVQCLPSQTTGVCAPLGQTGTEIVNQPVSEHDFLEEAKKWVQRAPLSDLDGLFRQPSGTPEPNDKLRNAIRDWLRDLADTSPDLTYTPPDTITISNPDGSTSTVENTDPAEDNAATPSQQPGTASTQWPGFCEWAPVVCDWIDWTKEEPEDMQPDELPVDELTVADLKKDYSSGLGGGSCPAPVEFTLQGQTRSFTYDNACWAATNLFKPILLTMAGIMAAFIIVGASRRAV